MKNLSFALLAASLLSCSISFAQDTRRVPESGATGASLRDTVSPGQAMPAPESLQSILCETGIFRKDKLTFVAITKTDKGFSYTFSDGTIGNMQDAGAPVECGKDAVLVRGKENWSKVVLSETNTRFESNGILLAGRLMEAPGAGKNTPLVVYAHGSEGAGWIDRAGDPYQMVGRGVSVFVYDKRGTGLSGGEYTQNFPLLAEDLVAASREAKRLAAGRYGRFGLVGLSQGGWIVPLASARAQADFLGVGYGLAVDITEQDAAQVTRELRDLGYGDDIVAKARKLTDITARIARSEAKESLDELAEVQNQFGKEVWFSRIKGGYSGALLGLSVDKLRQNGIPPQFQKLNIDWSLHPVQVLSKVNVPQMWAFADEDRQAPGAVTLERLSELRKQGSHITIYRFPDTGHGMREYVEAKDGTRKHVRIAPGFYELMADWAKGKLDGTYGKAYRQ
ncbi:alpha/beta hydrolase [Undibacterium sp. CY18W]|uniref:Alpha/beta hydrolase n=1 Tax=Undibacterium hunanense TaxID=2762292 RepID=A0ABR6ZQZ7_9BURK|nr:alpha/beta hydrolase [Undibacterium hunanense]MBC3918258.1 alpha/beta hydrolase [Undibacterium hunanense]